MLTEAKNILTDVASLDASKIDPIKRLLVAVIARAVVIARSLRTLWIVIGLFELGLAVGLILLLRAPEGSFGTASVVFGIGFVLLLALIGALVYALSLVVALPATLNAIAEAATNVIGDAKKDYAAVLEAGGWRGAVRTIWAAGRILIVVKDVMVEQEQRIRGFPVVVLLLTPPGWIAMAVLAAASLLLPVSAGLVVALRAGLA